MIYDNLIAFITRDPYRHKTGKFNELGPVQKLIVNGMHNATLSKKTVIQHHHSGTKHVALEVLGINRLKDDVYIIEYTSNWETELLSYLQIGYRASLNQFYVIESIGKSKDAAIIIQAIMPEDTHRPMPAPEWTALYNTCTPFVSKSNYLKLQRGIINAPSKDHIQAIIAGIDCRIRGIK